MVEGDSKVSRLVRVLSSVLLFVILSHTHLMMQEQSVHLWRQICSNRLLANATIILCFNNVSHGVTFDMYDRFTLIPERWMFYGRLWLLV
jgi:hypothetical protein